MTRFQLTPYRIRLALDLLAGAMVVSVAFALAGLTWRLAGHADAGAIAVPTTRRSAPVPDLTAALALAPFGRASGDATIATSLAIELKGLVFARPAELSIAYIAAGGEAAKPYRTGEGVSGATIEAIQPQRILLRNGGRLEFLAFPDPLKPAAAPGSAPVAAPPPPPAAAPPPVAADAATLMQKLDAQPVAGGYRLGANAPAGLRQGDVLESVNGTVLASPDAARDAFAKAQAAGNAQVTIVRDGKPVTLTLPIR